MTSAISTYAATAFCFVSLTAIAGEPTKERITCAAGFAPLRYFPGQRAETRARIGQQFDPFILADFCQTYFKTAV